MLGAKIQLAAGDRRHHLAAHYLAPPQQKSLEYEVGVGIVLAGVVAEGGIERPARTAPASLAISRIPGWKWSDPSSLIKTELAKSILAAALGGLLNQRVTIFEAKPGFVFRGWRR